MIETRREGDLDSQRRPGRLRRRHLFLKELVGSVCPVTFLPIGTRRMVSLTPHDERRARGVGAAA